MIKVLSVQSVRVHWASLNRLWWFADHCHFKVWFRIVAPDTVVTSSPES
jgi:hypothetical protein